MDAPALFDSANVAYSKADYKKALILYDSVIKLNYESGELYFNIGNAYFKTNEIGKAILNYERAKKINPSIADVDFNLAIANQKIEDKIDVVNNLFFTEIKNHLVDSFSEKTWSFIFLLLFVISLVLFFVYYVSRISGWRKLGFFGGMIALCFSVLIFFTAKSKYSKTVNSQSAIIISSSVTVMGSPTDSGTKLFIVHEGLKVGVSDKIGAYAEITLPNGKSGWVKNTEIEEI